MHETLKDKLAALTADQRMEFLKGIKKKLQESPADEKLVTAGKSKERYPLSFTQQRLWFLQELDPQSPFYNIPSGFQLRGDWDEKLLKRSMEELARRHDVLRTTFASDQEGAAVQIVADLPRLSWQSVDLQALPDQLQSLEMMRVQNEDVQRPCDLRNGPVWWATLVRLKSDEYRLIVTMHHIIFDGWSLSVFIKELAAIYQTLASGAEVSSLPVPTLQYSDYVAMQREKVNEMVLDKQLRYWTGHLQGQLPVLELPTDRPRPPVQTFKGAAYTVLLPQALYDDLKSFSRKQEATLFMTLLTLFKVLLYRYSGQTDITVGFPISGRHLPNTEQAIGVFVNTLPMRTDLSGEPSFADLLGKVRQTALEAYEHQDIPFDRLVDAVNPERSLSHNPLFQVLFTYQNALPEMMLGERSIVYEAVDGGTAKFDVSLDIYEGPEGPTCIFEYNTDLFDRQRIVRMADHFCTLAESVVRMEDCPISALPMLSETERHTILYEWSGESLAYERELQIHQWFERQADATPERPALVHNKQVWTYDELNARANQIARSLQQAGVEHGSRVGICLERSMDMVAAVLAVLKAGGAYVPIDPSYPADRIEFMLEDAQISILLTHMQTTDHFKDYSINQISLDGETLLNFAGEKGNLPVSGTENSLAYLIYTSGTTGKPKGTLVRHASLVNALVGWEKAYRLSSETRSHLQLASFSFDVFTGDWIRALCSGAKLVLVDKDVVLSAEQLYETMVHEQVDCAEFVPAVFRNLVQFLKETGRTLDFMRVLCIGSDRWYVHEYEMYKMLCGPQTTLINSYGLTEATIDTTYCDSGVEDLSPHQLMPIGRPFPNQYVYVLDASQQPVPAGIEGELYIGGRGLAAGYWNRPDLTAERFVQHPFSDEEGALLYRTGDRARFLWDGRLELIGRMDNQIKLRGYRIELGEIETSITSYPGVQACAVKVWEDSILAAWIIPEDSSEVNIERLRQALKNILPDYMVPAAYIIVDTLPLTVNGKIDLNALPAPEIFMDLNNAYVSPRTLTEEMLCEIWTEAFRVPRMGIHTDFFVSGGHSLLAIQILAQIRKIFKVDLSIQVLFKAPTIAELAAVIAQEKGELEHYKEAIHEIPECIPDAENRYEKFPLTDVQQAYWIGRNDAFEMGNVSTHSYDELDVEDFDADRFESAWNRLIVRHDMLRAIVTDDGMQQVLKEVPFYQIPFIQLQELEPEEVELKLASLRQEMSHQMLATNKWPVFDLRVSLLHNGRARIHLSSDALMFDAWSYVVLLRELAELHHNPDAELPELKITFRDYVQAEERMKASSAYQRSLEYWKSRVPELPPAPELPMAKSPDSLKNPYFTRLHNRLEGDHWSRLKTKATSMGLTASGVLLAAFAEVLAVWSKHPRFCLNLTFLNRMQLHPQVNEMVGEFTSLTLLEIDGSGSDRFVERAAMTQTNLWNDLEHHHVSGVQVLRELSRMHGQYQSALMPVVFTSALTLPIPDRKLTGFDLKPVYSITQTSQVWLDCGVWEDEKVLYCNWDVVRELFPEGMLEEMFTAFFDLLYRLANEDAIWHEQNVIRHPHSSLLDSAGERKEQEESAGLMLHELFSQKARQFPMHTAVSMLQRSMTYEELERLTNRLGRMLRQSGAGANQLVAVMMEKGWEQIAAVVSILKSGAAYLPIDPELPQERINYLLVQGEVSIVLTQPWIEEVMNRQDKSITWLIVDDGVAEGVEDEPLESAQQLKDLAYVIFTSGSTGKPKGVMINHMGAVNTILDVNDSFNITEKDRVLALSSLSFDLSVYDIFGVLAAGGTIVLPEAASRKDPAHWMSLMQKERVTLWNSVPALMGMLVEYAASRLVDVPESLRLILLSGDWIPLKLPEDIRSLSKGAEIVSLGGATEASIWSILYVIKEVNPGWSSIPYGRAMRNQGFHVLNSASLEPCPVWVTGHLYISGVGLAKGYYRDDEKTASSFIIHPRTGERLYRTGDLGRYLPDGNIEFLGREDFQVKVQGYRIELGEIEVALTQHPEVREAAAAVVVAEDQKPRLAAYWTGREASAEITQEELRSYLSSKLPHYMLPAVFLRLESMPLTSNGKVDRKALPVIKLNVSSPPMDTVFPRTDLEERLAALWRDVLKLNIVGVHDNFFELGGDSLLAVRFMIRLQHETGESHPLRVLFEKPTIAELAVYLESLVFASYALE
ncbi:amino acid adenylation domain protein [Paenibacillus algicola]|uniref:Phenyloxazoline synthase MbtB n=1 Tax=Paenibacillus algicola TaxID=2565926 RepID=A0A4P8XNT2_9BACL|nr:non-ribosomal peptide synthetase [Paenibacillus algicola]QCT03390.1 amino acid adenylation domain protein [Paenibacillus algicola]